METFYGILYILISDI